MKARLVSIQTKKSEEILSPKDDYQGCRVLKEVTLLKVRLDVELTTPDGMKRTEDDDAKLMRLNGKWYMRKPYDPD